MRWGISAAFGMALVEALCRCGAFDWAAVGLFFAAGLGGLALSSLPADEAEVPVWLRAIGLVLLGSYFLIYGVGGTLAPSVTLAFSDEFGRDSARESVIRAATMLVGGGLLVLIGRRAA